MKNLKVAAGFLITALLFYFLLRDLDFELFFSYLIKGDIVLILLGIAVYLLSFLIRGLRWKILLKHLGSFKVNDLAMLEIAGYAVNNVFPVRIGEFTRAWITGKRNSISRTSVLASIFVERIFDGLTIALILSATLFFYPFPQNVKTLAVMASAMFALLFLFIMFGTFSDKPLKLIRMLKSKLPEFTGFIFDIAEKFLKGASSLNSLSQISAVTFLSILVWVFELTVYILISRAFEVDIPFAGYLFMLCAANLGMLAAPTPGGLAVFQAAIVFALRSFTILYEKRMAVAIILHMAQIIPVTIIGLMWLYLNHISVLSAQNDTD
ncbi:MAG TPA: lysylphosphatidylglycerol synthase transmembrane domain-containing protein [bacterium]|nr:lysylphosphatidylglycerol synthase transmembrane domain-containing protein [bacterium]HPM47610.1 lysylphosphatidylglycerol synthase transmembrane domain-containing protein [bacterium]HRQ70534.1 lysylphosphatidylglycerol synthase transmembrane domain-containing protein [bacterium]